MPSKEIMRLREIQIEMVMPEIGGLLDAYDNLPNDIKDDIELLSPSLTAAISRIKSGMER